MQKRRIALLALVPAAGALVLAYGWLAGEGPVKPKAHPGDLPIDGRPRPVPDRKTPELAPTKPGPVAPEVHEPKSELGPVALLLAKIRKAHDARDQGALAALRSEIEALIQKDPAAALKGLLAALRDAQNEVDLGLVLSLLKNEAGLPRAEVAAALADMAQHDELPLRRAAALKTLGDLPDPDSTRLDLIASLGRGDAAPEVREAAAFSLGALGDRSPGPLAASAAKDLVDSLNAETDPRVRASLIFALRDTRDPAVAQALLAALTDADTGVRQAAANMLGGVAAANRASAVSALAAQFVQEPNPDVRMTIVVAIVSAGRLSAIPTLEGLAGGDLQPTIDDYLFGLRSGEDNVDKLFGIRMARERARKTGH
jgi:HEAT repeat protein